MDKERVASGQLININFTGSWKYSTYQDLLTDRVFVMQAVIISPVHTS